MSLVLIVLGCVLAPVAVIGVWAGNEVSDTGRYAATVEPLIIRLYDLHRRSGLRGSGFQEPRIVCRSGLEGHHLVQSGEV